MQPPNKQLPHIKIINGLRIVFYHSITITWTF